MAPPVPTASSTKETTNYARLCRLLVDVGTQAVRDTFNAIHPPANLNVLLAGNKATLQPLRARKIINPTQWGKLFPAIPSSVSSASFDITLLMVLLRNLCGLAAPATGWDALPATTDVSLEADIARIKYFRNAVYAHAEHASVDDATFNTYWIEIRDSLVRLGGVAYRAAIDNLETECMDPDVEEHYKELLQQWKNDEDNIKDELKEIGIDIKILTKKIDNLVTSTVTSKEETGDGKMRNLEMDTALVCKEKHHENELLKSFCKQCKVCICDKCGQTRHNHHTKVDIDQAAKDRKVNIQEITEEMKKGISNIQMYRERSKELSRKSREKIAAARNKAMTSIEELIRVLKEHETTTLTSLDVIDETEKRGHATQLEHFQSSINQLQTSVEYCEAILQRNKSVEILQVHQALIERCKGLLNAEKRNINKPFHTALHTRYEINEELVESVRHAVPGRVIFSITDPLQSGAEGKGLQEADVGSKAHFRIITKDSNGKQYHDKDNRIIVKAETPSGEELKHNISSDGDGEYNVTYKPDCHGQHNVVIEINGQPLTDSPWRVQVSPHRYKSSFLFGSRGEAKGQFDWPSDIAINDTTGNIAVADFSNNRVQLFSSQGEYLKAITTKELTGPTIVAFTRSSDLIVVASRRIFCFNESGKFVKNITSKHLKKPYGSLTIARDGRMLVCDGNGTVKVLTSDGSQLLHTISDPDRARPNYAVCHQDKFVVSYYWADNVKIFSKDGLFMYSIGTPGSGDGQLCRPAGLTIDRFSNLVVCDSYNSRLQIFAIDGKFLSTIGGGHTSLKAPCSVAVSPTGQLFVTDVIKHCVHVFQ